MALAPNKRDDGGSHDDRDERTDDPGDWRLDLLRQHAARSLEDQEMILRARLLLENLELALFQYEQDDPVWKRPYKGFIDQVWSVFHHGEPARVTAMAICAALNESGSAADVVKLLKIRGYVQLAAGLDEKQIERARAAWFDRTKGMKPGRVGKFELIARMVRGAGLTISAATIERLWRDKQGWGSSRKKQAPKKKPT